MPIYEFHCQRCGRESEILVRTRTTRGTKCPHCGSTRLTRKFSVFASTSGSAASAGSACATGTGRGGCGCCCSGGHSH